VTAPLTRSNGSHLVATRLQLELRVIDASNRKRRLPIRHGIEYEQIDGTVIHCDPQPVQDMIMDAFSSTMKLFRASIRLRWFKAAHLIFATRPSVGNF
jgi:hypothetical protein